MIRSRLGCCSGVIVACARNRAADRNVTPLKHCIDAVSEVKKRNVVEVIVVHIANTTEHHPRGRTAKLHSAVPPSRRRDISCNDWVCHERVVRDCDKRQGQRRSSRLDVTFPP